MQELLTAAAKRLHDGPMQLWLFLARAALAAGTVMTPSGGTVAPPRDRSRKTHPMRRLP